MRQIDYDNLTPMMRQYVDIKNDHLDAILMFRLGDFYEMFFDDAEVASKELDIVLTARDSGSKDKVPMCGVPYHAADNYINRLINKGYKVAICEQLEDPSQSKGIVKRGVTRVITPGTNLKLSDEEKYNNFLASLYIDNDKFALSYLDYSTGELFTSLNTEEKGRISSELQNQLSILEIKEIIINSEDFPLDSFLLENMLINYSQAVEQDEEKHILQQIMSLNIDNTTKDLIDKETVVKSSLVQLFKYLNDTQFGAINHIRKLVFIDLSEYMTLDRHTLYSLDIFSEKGNKIEGTLLDLLDDTKTSMGSRKLRYFLEHPLKSESDIETRLDVVEAFKDNLLELDNLRKILYRIYDIERILVRISGQANSPKDLIQLSKSLNQIDALLNILNAFNLNHNLNLEILRNRQIVEIIDLLNSSIKEDAPFSSKEGNIIKENYSPELDEIKNSSINSKFWIKNYEEELKENTGIKNLKIKYNKILGYFIEVTKSNTDRVPEYFIRKQTLVGSERYFTDKLKETEINIISSKDRINSFEYELYEEIRSYILESYDLLIDFSETIATLDVFSNFAYIAHINDYVRPSISTDNNLDILEGRHPIVEKNVDIFISNNTIIDNNANFVILTGPNMAGKSTYMRQIALMSIMMQIGSFVPAKEAKMPVFDRVFTRIGAHDDLYLGDSTFMVEMKEMADIINNATKNSLIILDEVGRGTSTYDGLSLARALIEFIIEKINAKTIFATHFHELTDLEKNYTSIKNQTMAVNEEDGDIRFLRKVIDGSSDKSYGIHVATLAGVNEEIIEKANKYLLEYETFEIPKKVDNLRQLEFLGNSFNTKVIKEKYIPNEIVSFIKEIESIDINNTTPIDAISKLNEIYEKSKELLDEKD